MALFVAPILYIQRKQKAKTAKLLSDFLRLAEARQLKITAHELWSECYGIGLDEGQQKLFYVSTREGNEQQVQINLTDVKKCAVVSAGRDVSDGKVIDQVELRLTPRNGKELHLEFYNKEENLHMSGELQIAQKWSDLVNAAVAAVPVATRPPVATA